jgi:hypothetical protein
MQQRHENYEYISLLCKWWWLLESGEGLWQEIVRLKYVK